MVVTVNCVPVKPRTFYFSRDKTCHRHPRCFCPEFARFKEVLSCTSERAARRQPVGCIGLIQGDYWGSRPSTLAHGGLQQSG